MNGKQIRDSKGVQAAAAKRLAPMRELDNKEIRQVAGGQVGFPYMGPKKP